MSARTASAKKNEPTPHSARVGLELRLFGPIEVRIGGRPLRRLRSRKGLWLIGLLALRNGRDVDRSWIAGTLWSDSDESHALRSLRQTLHDLRAALGTEAWRLGSKEPRTIRLDLRDASIDILEFDQAIERADLESLENALRIYRGPILEDCLEEWCAEDRRRREQSYLQALKSLADGAAERGDSTTSADYLRLAIAVEPYREDLQRELMVRLAMVSPAAALLAYRQFRALLGREMMAEPTEETSALFRRIRDESRAHANDQPKVLDQPPRQPHDEAWQPRPIPFPLTELIGRDDAVREVIEEISRSRLVTLTGTGGVGKTRLAIQVAHELSGAFSDGAVFVDLSSLEDRVLVPHAVWAAIGIPPDEGKKPPLDTLSQALSNRRMLLLLDNCEHLDRACGSLAEKLLGRCAGLKILATSRRTLGVQGETIWRVPSLALPKTGSRRPIRISDIGHIATYLDYPAIRLFAERARAAEATFEVSRKNSVSIVKICTLLDGIPLAIELAAARVKALSVEKIAERLNDRFRILIGNGTATCDAAVSRHETLRASIDWSYDLLSDHERSLLKRLSVFSGGWTLEAAEAVCSSAPIREWEVIDLMTGLVEKSLVAFQADEGRYRLLETIRQYLADRLHAEDGRTEVAERHLRYFLELAEAVEPQLIGPAQTVWMDRLESDHDNLRSALAWSRSERGDIDAGLRMVGTLVRFWQVRGYHSEGREHVALTLAASHEPTASRAKALNVGGILAYRQSDYAAAHALYGESLAIRRQLADRAGIASSLCNLGVITLEQGEVDAARRLYEESLSICRELDHRWGLALCLHHLGTAAYAQADYETARARYEESLAIRRELGDSAGIAYALSNLGSIAHRQGKYFEARALHEEALVIRRQMGDRPGIAETLYDLGLTLEGQGDHELASSLQLEGLAMQRDLGHRMGIAESLKALASLASQATTGSDRACRAPRLFGAAEALREAIGAPIPQNEKEEYARRVERARSAIDPRLFDSAWEEGRAMTLEEAVRYALGSGTK